MRGDLSCPGNGDCLNFHRAIGFPGICVIQPENKMTLTLKADSHNMPFPCRAHAVPLPCRAAKGLERVFPI